MANWFGRFIDKVKDFLWPTKEQQIQRLHDDLEVEKLKASIRVQKNRGVQRGGPKRQGTSATGLFRPSKSAKKTFEGPVLKDSDIDPLKYIR